MSQSTPQTFGQSFFRSILVLLNHPYRGQSCTSGLQANMKTTSASPKHQKSTAAVRTGRYIFSVSTINFPPHAVQIAAISVDVFMISAAFHFRRYPYLTVTQSVIEVSQCSITPCIQISCMFRSFYAACRPCRTVFQQCYHNAKARCLASPAQWRCKPDQTSACKRRSAVRRFSSNQP